MGKMISIELEAPDVDDQGRILQQHIAHHRIRGVAGGADQTLCGKIILYNEYKGLTPNAGWCEECQALDG